MFNRILATSLLLPDSFPIDAIQRPTGISSVIALINYSRVKIVARFSISLDRVTRRRNEMRVGRNERVRAYEGEQLESSEKSGASATRTGTGYPLRSV